mgnify:FL=1
MSVKLKPEVKALWTAALRSGEFKQGYQRLRTGDAMCCLGVLCELHQRETGNAYALDWKEHGAYGGESLTPPSVVYKWALQVNSIEEIGHYGLAFRGDDTQHPNILNGHNLISGANDTGLTFNEIADAIDIFL